VNKSFQNELERASSRPDANKLLMILKEYARWHDDGCPQGETDHILDDWIFNDSDKERSLALVILAMANFDDPGFLGLVAAGPLEDIFFAGAEVPEEIMARIEDEARRTPRFRWMLSGVWTTSFLPETEVRVRHAVGQADMEKDPLPQRPWA
jgi:hypothetical protein